MDNKENNTVVNNATEEEQHLPDINQILAIVVNVCMGKASPSQAVQKLSLAYKDEAIFLAKEKAQNIIEEYLKKSERSEVRELAAGDFSDRMVNSTQKIGLLIYQYYMKEITPEELIDSLANTGIKKVMIDAADALGIPELLNAKDMQTVLRMSSAAVAYSALTAAYQILEKALEDDRIAHEQRILIEAQCAESVRNITKYRQEMERVVSEYLSDHYSVFEAGFLAMDKAIIENDVDGYIKGNADIQAVLGYGPRFASQEEFDDLMLSDEAFKL